MIRVNCYDSNGIFQLSREFFTQSTLTQFKKIVELIVRDWTVTDNDKRETYKTIGDILTCEYRIENMQGHKGKCERLQKKCDWLERVMRGDKNV